MSAALRTFYDEGRTACLLERLCASVDRSRFGPPLAGAFAAWIAAVETLCLDTGVPADEARARAEDAVARVEGSLVLAVGMGDPEVFGRALVRVQRTLLVPVDAPTAASPG